MPMKNYNWKNGGNAANNNYGSQLPKGGYQEADARGGSPTDFNVSSYSPDATNMGTHASNINKSSFSRALDNDNSRLGQTDKIAKLMP